MTIHATYKKLERSRTDRMAAGVCGGLGRYFDVNPTFYRVGFAILTLLGGAGILIYAAAVLVIPDEGEEQSIVEDVLRNHRSQPFRLIALGIVGISALVLLAHASIWPHGDFAWALLFLAGLALLVSQRGRDKRAPRPSDGSVEPWQPAPVPPRRFPVTLGLLGLLVIQTGIFAALMSAGVDIPWGVAFAIEAVTAGAVLVAGAFTHQRVGGLLVIAVFLAAASIAASTVHLHLSDGIGNRYYTPVTAASLRHDYRLGVGDLQLDLTNTRLPAGRTTIAAHVGVGHLLVIVPRSISVRVTSTVDWGESEILGESHNGHHVDTSVTRTTTGEPTLVIDAHMGAGQIQIQRAYP